jgi:hypothetical protein
MADQTPSLDAVAAWYGRGAITIEEAARLLELATPTRAVRSSESAAPGQRKRRRTGRLRWSR